MCFLFGFEDRLGELVECVFEVGECDVFVYGEVFDLVEDWVVCGVEWVGVVAMVWIDDLNWWFLVFY